LLDRVARRPQQSNLDPKSELSRAQDRRQNWLGIAAAARAAQYVETPVRQTALLGGAAVFGAARPAAAPPAERSVQEISDLGAAEGDQTPEEQAAMLMGAARSHKKQIDYSRPDDPTITLDPVEEEMTLTLHASPDAGWQMLKPFLTEGPGDLVVGMYDFTAPHIDEAVRAGRGNAGALTMTLDHPPGSARREQTIDDTESDLAGALQERLTFAWAL